MRWYRYVVNWSLRDQIGVAASAQREVLHWSAWLKESRESLRSVPRAVVVVSAAAVFALLAILWRAGPNAARHAQGAGSPRFYLRALRALRRRGFRRGAGETAREFRQRVAAEAPAFAEPFQQLTAVYEGCRFGGRALSPEEGAMVEAALAQLRSRP
jgi:hypothetical protein